MQIFKLTAYESKPINASGHNTVGTDDCQQDLCYGVGSFFVNPLYAFPGKFKVVLQQ